MKCYLVQTHAKLKKETETAPSGKKWRWSSCKYSKRNNTSSPAAPISPEFLINNYKFFLWSHPLLNLPPSQSHSLFLVCPAPLHKHIHPLLPLIRTAKNRPMLYQQPATDGSGWKNPRHREVAQHVGQAQTQPGWFKSFSSSCRIPCPGVT